MDATEPASGRSCLQPGDLIGLNGVGLAFEIKWADVDGLDERRDKAVGGPAHEHGAGPRQRLHSRGDVHGVAHRGVLARGVRADDADQR